MQKDTLTIILLLDVYNLKKRLEKKQNTKYSRKDNLRPMQTELTLFGKEFRELQQILILH